MSNQSRTLVLRNIVVMHYSTEEDKLIPSLLPNKTPVMFSYKANLFNVLRSSPEGKSKNIKDVMQVEELIQRLIATKAGEAIVLNDSEFLLIKETFDNLTYPASSFELKQMYVDITNAPLADVVDRKED